MDKKQKETIIICNALLSMFAGIDPDAMEFFNKAFDKEIKKEKKNEETNKTR